MSLLDVSVGTVFWASLAFIIVLVLLKKMAWGPILKSLKDREESIENALNEAQKAKEEMAQLKAGNEMLLAEARDERDRILREAKEIKDEIIAEAKEKAHSEGDRILAAAREEIDNQKKAAITELKSQVAILSIEIAEKVVKESLSNDDKQKALVNNLLDSFKLN